jgi:hypothetical protein
MMCSPTIFAVSSLIWLTSSDKDGIGDTERVVRLGIAMV